MKKFLIGIGLLLLWYIAYQLPGAFLGAALASTDYQGAVLFYSMISVALYLLLVWYSHRYYKKLQMTVEGVDKELENVWFPILLLGLLLVCEFLLPDGNGSTNQQIITQMIYVLPVQSFLFTVIFAPILEEYIFRGFVRYYFFPKIKNNDEFILYGLVSSALFAAIHSPSTFLQFLVYFIMGLSFTWMYMTRRNIYHSIALHALNNLIGFMLITMV